MADLILGLLIIAAVAAVFIKRKTDKAAGKSGCCDSCSGCAHGSICLEKQEKTED